MVKSLIKETIILLLLILAILLILGLFFYDKIPTSKIVPSKIAYTTPENVEQELKEEILQDDTEVIITYQIEDVDLKVYQQQGSYDKGKANPFADYVEPVTNTNQNPQSGSQVSTNTTTNTPTNTTVNTNNVGNFFDKPINK